MTDQFTSDKSKKRARKTAVALKKDSQSDPIPRVTASGQGQLAEKILKIAFENNVKVRQDADLAEILAKIDVESEIPTEALLAVAEILAYIYETNRTAYAHLNPDIDTQPSEPNGL